MSLAVASTVVVLSETNCMPSIQATEARAWRTVAPVVSFLSTDTPLSTNFVRKCRHLWFGELDLSSKRWIADTKCIRERPLEECCSKLLHMSRSRNTASRSNSRPSKTYLSSMCKSAVFPALLTWLALAPFSNKQLRISGSVDLYTAEKKGESLSSSTRFTSAPYSTMHRTMLTLLRRTAEWNGVAVPSVRLEVTKLGLAPLSSKFFTSSKSSAITAFNSFPLTSMDVLSGGLASAIIWELIWISYFGWTGWEECKLVQTEPIVPTTNKTKAQWHIRLLLNFFLYALADAFLWNQNDLS